MVLQLMVILKLAWQETAGDKRNMLYYKKVLLLYMAHGEHFLHLAEKLALNFPLINENIGLFVKIWSNYHTRMGQVEV